MLEIGQKVKVTAVFDGEDWLASYVGKYGKVVCIGSRGNVEVALGDGTDWYFPVTGVVPRPAHRGVYNPEHWGEKSPDLYDLGGPGAHACQ